MNHKSLTGSFIYTPNLRVSSTQKLDKIHLSLLSRTSSGWGFFIQLFINKCMKNQLQIQNARIVIKSARRGKELLKRLNVFPWTLFSQEKHEEFFTPMILLLGQVVEAKVLPKKEQKEALTLLQTYQSLEVTHRPNRSISNNTIK